jgi:phosphomannomutase/phosphoglucomutase
VGSLVLPEIVRKLGGKPLTINCNLDPHFPWREPEPTPETLKETSVIVKNLSADLGIGVDGDADRAIIISDDGDVKWGDRTAVVLAPYIMRMYPNLPRRVYTGVSSSYFIEEILGREGIKVIWMKVGSVDISRRLVKENGLFGFEENGGFMFPEHQPVRDAGATLAYIMELLSLENKKISQLYEVYPKTYTIKTKVPLPREKALKVVEEISSIYSGQQMVRIDGVKVLLDNAWFLVRPSGTEPVLRIMIEALEKTRAEQILEELMKTVKKYAGESEKS